MILLLVQWIGPGVRIRIPPKHWSQPGGQKHGFSRVRELVWKHKNIADGNGQGFAHVAAQFEKKWPSQKPTLARQPRGCVAMLPVWTLS